MKVLWFSPIPIIDNQKNSGTWIISLLNNLASNIEDIDISVAFKSNCSELTIEIITDKIKLIQIPYFHAKSESNYRIKKLLRLYFPGLFYKTNRVLDYSLRIIKDIKPDVIQVFGFENEFGNIISHTDIPVIIHIQGILNIWIEKWFLGYSKLETLKYSSYKNIILKTNFLYNYLNILKDKERETKIIKDCKYFIGRTKFDESFINCITPQASYFHCNEIMREEFYLNSWLTPKDNNELVISSTISDQPYKGLETIFKTLPLLIKYSPYKVKWKVIGLSYNSNSFLICSRKFKTCFTDALLLLGNLNASEIVNHLKTSNVFVQPSHIENSSNSLSEAMLLGMPVIAMYVGGNPTIVKENAGILVADLEPYSLYDSILYLFENRLKAIEMGKQARTLSLERHDISKISSQMNKIYNNVVTQNKCNIS